MYRRFLLVLAPLLAAGTAHADDGLSGGLYAGASTRAQGWARDLDPFLRYGVWLADGDAHLRLGVLNGLGFGAVGAEFEGGRAVAGDMLRLGLLARMFGRVGREFGGAGELFAVTGIQFRLSRDFSVGADLLGGVVWPALSVPSFSSGAQFTFQGHFGE